MTAKLALLAMYELDPAIERVVGALARRFAADIARNLFR